MHKFYSFSFEYSKLTEKFSLFDQLENTDQQNLIGCHYYT